MGHICFEVKTAFLWQIFRHPYRKILTLYVIYAKLLLYLNNYRNTGAKQIRKLSAEPNKESGANPVLSNIYLTAFDKLLESRGHKFVRYADDCNIYVKSRRAAERVMANCVKFLEGKLKLKVNQQKSQVGSPLKLKFLGFSLYKTGKKAGIRPHGKSIKRFKDKIRELTSRKQARSVENILKRIKRYTTGWLGYYSIADMESKIRSLNEWLRRRIRKIYWKQWKKIKTRHDNLVRLGINKQKAWEWANSRKGYWRIADSYILHRSLTNEYLASVGYDDILKRYKGLHSNY